MIVFSLQCTKGHSFDEWFSSSADYAAQKKSKSLACPTCGDKKVEKALMAPAVGKSSPAQAPAPACGAPACGNGACPMSGVK